MPKKKPPQRETIISLEQSLPEVPERSPYEIPTRHLEKDGKGGYRIINGRRPSKTLLAEQLRKEVDTWREHDSPGICNITRRLLDWWFQEEHYAEKSEQFKFYFCQQEAIETIR